MKERAKKRDANMSKTVYTKIDAAVQNLVPGLNEVNRSRNLATFPSFSVCCEFIISLLDMPSSLLDSHSQ